MALIYNPKRWDVLMCDFNTGFVFPEMIKERLVVIISEQLKGELPLCRVVPLSGTEPPVIRPFHYKMHSHSLPDPFKNSDMWAKCDMICTVALHRLSRVKIGKNRTTGERIYSAAHAIPEDIQGVKKAILHALKMDTLTQYL